MTHEEELLNLIPLDGTAIGNVTLQRKLEWSAAQYAAVRKRLLEKGEIVKHPGRGGAVRRSAAQADDEALLERLPKDGTTVSKSRLLEKLNWTEDRYYTARDRLADTGQIIRGRGRGGTLRLAAIAKPTKETKKQAAKAPPPAREDTYYAGIARTLKAEWAKERGFTKFEVEDTSKQGRKETGGRWTRPDLTVISLTKYRYVPGTFLDVTTFEVKTLDGLDVTGVYEALAHRRCATRAYLICVTSTATTTADDERLQAVEEEASRHGIGFIVCEDPDDYETWVERAEPSRVDADPERINQFIARQVGNDLQLDVLEWLR